MFFIVVFFFNTVVHAAYVLRNLDNQLDVEVRDQKGEVLLRDSLHNNAEIILPLYYLRLAQAKKLEIVWRKELDETEYKISFPIQYQKNENTMYNLWCAQDVTRDNLEVKAKKMRTILPRIPISEKKISGLYLRNIDDTTLRVILGYTHIEKKKEFFFDFFPNEEVFVDPEFLKKNNINFFEVSLQHFGKILYTNPIESPVKIYGYEKVWNILRPIHGFFSKHVKNGDGSETVAYRKEECVNYEELLKRTGFHKPRQEAMLIKEKIALQKKHQEDLHEEKNRPNSAHLAESK